MLAFASQKPNQTKPKQATLLHEHFQLQLWKRKVKIKLKVNWTNVANRIVAQPFKLICRIYFYIKSLIHVNITYIFPFKTIINSFVFSKIEIKQDQDAIIIIHNTDHDIVCNMIDYHMSLCVPNKTTQSEKRSLEHFAIINKNNTM